MRKSEIYGFAFGKTNSAYTLHKVRNIDHCYLLYGESSINFYLVYLFKMSGAGHFARNARYWFAHGTKEDKRTILQALGLNLTLDNRKLHINLQKPFSAIKEAANIIKSNTSQFEPNENTLSIGKTNDFEIEYPIWGHEPRINITAILDSIVLAFQDIRYIGELRQRWNEIKKLHTANSYFAV